MKKLALALVAATTFAFTAPTFAATGSPERIQLAQADVTVKKKVVVRHRGEGMRRKVVIHRDRGMHRGWREHHHGRVVKKTVIKHRGNKTVVKKVVRH